MADLIPAGTKVQVSSTAPGTSRRSLLRDDDEAWTATSVPAHIVLTFPPNEPVAAVHAVALTFQGGFVASSVTVTATTAGEAGENLAVPLGKIFPEDVNRRQVLELPTAAQNVSAIRLELESSTDHHERVTIYRLELF